MAPLERFVQYGADGYNEMAPTLPVGLDDFIELVLPEPRRRRLFRSDYTGRTLRDHLGLRRPARRAFAVSSAPATSAGSTAAFA